MNPLPILKFSELGPTRDYLQDVTKVMGKLQQAFLPAEPHGWQYGLEITMRGISTQSFMVDGQPTRALLDLVRHKLRIGGQNWPLRENPPALLLAEVKKWLVARRIPAQLDDPILTAGVLEYDAARAEAYAAALWWLEEQFRELKASLKGGLAAPILLYPHHFDLSLVWYPKGDEEQVAIGWSTGDDIITEPYVYLTTYPDPDRLRPAKLPPGAYWQSQGFSGAILPYAALQKSAQPSELLKMFYDIIE